MKIQRSMLLVSCLFGCGLAISLAAVGPAGAASPTPAQALALNPIQQGVDCDRPSSAEAERCKIEAEKVNGRVGWTVTSPTGVVLRKFLDSNGDNRVDCWSYFKDGLEVYRDMDADFNRKVDQCRWYNTAGSRWGIDKNEDGKIDQWKMISAEETAAEAVAALAAGEWPRMQRLTLSADEAKTLGLDPQKQAQLLRKIEALAKDFQTAVKDPKHLSADARWIQFSGGMPGVVPRNVDAAKPDLMVYENAVAVVQSNGQHGELLLGTLVRVGDSWRMVDVPRMMAEGPNSLAAGFFFAPPLVARAKTDAAGAPSQAAQAILDELEKLDKALQNTTDAKQLAVLAARRADLMEKAAEAADTPAARTMWYRQLADMASAGQTGSYADGAERLRKLYEKMSKNPADKDIAAYVRLRQIMAEYGLSFQVPKPDYEKIQKTLVENIEKFIEQYPNSTETPEAMLQLAMTLEFVGEEEKAMKWHERIVRDTPRSPVADKARGAYARLDSVGKHVAVSGKSFSGGQVDLDDYRGKAVLVQYWFSGSDPAKTDMPALKELVGKYGGRFAVVGVSLDLRRADLESYLKENPLPWPQIFEEGGLDSRPSNQMGIFTVPTMILVDTEGKVVNRNITIAELDKELKRILR